MEAEARPRTWGAVLVGLLAGFLAGLFGVGGGILIVPGLVLLLGTGQRLAQGTSLAAIIPIAAAGMAGFALEGSVDWPVAGLLAVGSAAGAVLGTQALQRMRPRRLRMAFGALLVLTAVRLLLVVPAAPGRGALSAGLGAGLLGLGLLAGIVAGLFGVGGGVVTIPVLVILFAIPDPVAKGTSLVVILPTALVGTLRNLRHGNADLAVAAATGVSGVISAFAASQLAVRLEPRTSAVLFAVLLLAVSVRMLLTGRAATYQP